MAADEPFPAPRKTIDVALIESPDVSEKPTDGNLDDCELRVKANAVKQIYNTTGNVEIKGEASYRHWPHAMNAMP